MGRYAYGTAVKLNSLCLFVPLCLFVIEEELIDFIWEKQGS